MEITPCKINGCPRNYLLLRDHISFSFGSSDGKLLIARERIFLPRNEYYFMNNECYRSISFGF